MWNLKRKLNKKPKQTNKKTHTKFIEKRSDLWLQRQRVGAGEIGGRWSKSTNFRL